LGVGFALIIAIGPQNILVIKQGLKKEHVFVAALFCSCSDMLLIALGVLGLGSLLTLHPVLILVARWLGIVFLTCYAFKSFHAAIKPDILKIEKDKGASLALSKMLTLLFCFSFLNPHVYLDTVILIGSLSAQHHPYANQVLFGVGAVLASFMWFFTIAYGARLLTPWFKKQMTWRILDLFVGVIMSLIAVSLLVKTL